MYNFVTRIESGDAGEDRLVVEHRDGRLLILVADGSGGSGAGGAAADWACALALASFLEGAKEQNGWVETLTEMDKEILYRCDGGETTLVVLEIADDRLWGASVGDSAAWAVDSDVIVDVTRKQHRKPLLGSGEAISIGFGPTAVPSRLLVGTDGLFKYCSMREITEIAAMNSLDEAADALVSSVRMPSGGLQDDIAVVLCDFPQLT